MGRIERMQHPLPKHQAITVDTAWIEIDAALWDAVRMAVPPEDTATWAREELVVPVAERAGKLVPLAWFETVVELLDTGAEQLKVWIVDRDERDSLEEYAVVFSMKRGQ